MMNVVALCLVFSSLVTAGIWSPSPAAPERDVLVKEGHRTVEIEYGEEDGNTKVKISPQEGQTHEDSSSNLKGKVSEGVENAKEKLDEAIGHKSSPRELVCDAYGKCKHKIASAVGKTKEVLSEKAQEVKGKVEDVEEAAEETVGKMKDAATQKSHEAKEKVKGVKKEGIDIGKTLTEDMKTNATRELEMTKQRLKKAGEILKKGGGFLGYFLPAKIMASGLGILRLIALSAAYGMSIWITFISSHIMAEGLPRQQFAVLQSKIYPVYFKTMAYCVGVALLSHCLSPSKGLFSSRAEMFQGFSLLATLSMILFNLRFLEPRATKIMFERMKLEKEEGRGMEKQMENPPTADPGMRQINSFTVQPAQASASGGSGKSSGQNPSTTPEEGGDVSEAARSDLARLSEMLKKLNSYSSFVNVLTVMSLTWHLVHLGKMIHTNAE